MAESEEDGGKEDEVEAIVYTDRQAAATSKAIRAALRREASAARLLRCMPAATMGEGLGGAIPQDKSRGIWGPILLIANQKNIARLLLDFD